MSAEKNKFDPDKYLQPIFSEKAQINTDHPIVVVSAEEIAKANARIAVSVRQNQRERGEDEMFSRVCLP
jgi:hypothetical protein